MASTYGTPAEQGIRAARKQAELGRCGVCGYDIQKDGWCHSCGRYYTVDGSGAGHSGECLSNRRDAEKRRAEWERQWPGYCQTCGGYGAFTGSFKPAPGAGWLDCSDPCPECSEEGKCGRCGAELRTDDCSGPCPECGWNYDDGLPQTWECICSEDYHRGFSNGQ